MNEWTFSATSMYLRHPTGDLWTGNEPCRLWICTELSALQHYKPAGKAQGLGHCHPFVELRCHLLVHRGTCPRAGKWPRWCHITSKAPSPCKDKREVFVHKVYDPWDTRLLLPLSGGLLTDQEMLCVPTEVLKWAVNIKSKTILVQTAA